MELLDPIINKVLEYLGFVTEFIRTFVEKLAPEMAMTIYLALALVGTYYLNRELGDSQTAFWVVSVLAIVLALKFV